MSINPTTGRGTVWVEGYEHAYGGFGALLGELGLFVWWFDGITLRLGRTRKRA